MQPDAFRRPLGGRPVHHIAHDSAGSGSAGATSVLRAPVGLMVRTVSALSRRSALLGPDARAASSRREHPYHGPVLMAGIARRDITPRLGSPAGLSLTLPVRSIWDPLSATALALEGDDGPWAIVGLDLTGVLAATHLTIRRAVAAATAIPADRVVLSSSHTHSAPYVSSDAQVLLRAHGLSLTDDDYEPTLAGAVALAVTDAMADLRPVATVGAARGRVDRVAANRRPVGPDGQVVHRHGRPPAWMRDLPEGRIDPDVAVIRLDASDGRPIATVLCYACHPTAAGGDDHAHVSADLVGAARSRVEATTGSPTLFLQGCAGDQGTGNG